MMRWEMTVLATGHGAVTGSLASYERAGTCQKGRGARRTEGRS